MRLALGEVLHSWRLWALQATWHGRFEVKAVNSPAMIVSIFFDIWPTELLRALALRYWSQRKGLSMHTGGAPFVLDLHAPQQNYVFRELASLQRCVLLSLWLPDRDLFEYLRLLQATDLTELKVALKTCFHMLSSYTATCHIHHKFITHQIIPNCNCRVLPPLHATVSGRALWIGRCQTACSAQSSLGHNASSWP